MAGKGFARFDSGASQRHWNVSPFRGKGRPVLPEGLAVANGSGKCRNRPPRAALRAGCTTLKNMGRLPGGASGCGG